MGLSAVLFDMDGLLVDTEPLWLRAEYATLAELGGQWSEADQAAILGASMAHAARYMKQRSGTELPEAEVGAILVDRMMVELADARIPIRPGAGELLTEVADSGLPYALVSASVRPIVDLVLAALARAGLPGFPLTIAGDEVARSKPDPLPYLRAAEALAIDVTRAVVLEDSANGVRAASEAGAVVVAVPHAVPIEPAARIHVRASLVGLRLADLRRMVTDG
jgi:HAD superfamily hydrolase (TIGR01509 family)